MTFGYYLETKMTKTLMIDMTSLHVLPVLKIPISTSIFFLKYIYFVSSTNIFLSLMHILFVY